RRAARPPRAAPRRTNRRPPTRRPPARPAMPRAATRPRPARAAPARRGSPMSLIERRIGLLFAGILLLLVFAAARTTWLGVVKGSSLRQRASEQQVSQA